MVKVLQNYPQTVTVSAANKNESDGARGSERQDAGTPYAGTAGSPYAYDPYGGSVPTLGEAVSMKTTKTRRRNPSKKKDTR